MLIRYFIHTVAVLALAVVALLLLAASLFVYWRGFGFLLGKEELHFFGKYGSIGLVCALIGGIGDTLARYLDQRRR